MEVNKEKGCELCNQKPVYYTWGKKEFDIYGSSTEVTHKGLTGVNIGVDENGKVGCFSDGETISEFYYFNYCPKCGRKLQ